MMTEKRYSYDPKQVAILKDGKFWLEGQIDTACNHSEICNELNQLAEENIRLKKKRNHFEKKKTEYLTEWNKSRIQNTELKNLIQEAYTNERTQIGRNTLKQLLEQI